MDNFQLYGTWKQVLGQWLTDRCPTRRANLAWLIVGLQQGGKVQSSAIVSQWGVQAKNTSLTRRLSRFLDNGAVRPTLWYRRVARQVLARGAGQRVTLIIDATRVTARRQLVMVAVAYRKRALPVAWSWVNYAKGHLTSAKVVNLLKRVQRWMPAGVRVGLVGDAGFGSVGLIRALRAWGWDYVLRQVGKVKVQVTDGAAWQRLDSLVRTPGQSYWAPQARLTARWAQPTAVLAYWAPGHDAPWLLATNLPNAAAVLHVYPKRMGIEAMFGDWKGHGWDLETSHLRHVDRLSRLVLAVALLYVWLVRYGERVIKAGWRTWVDRHERRDLSLFRLGLLVLHRCHALGQSPPLPLPSLVGGPSVR
jgi:hypothetical protein